MDANFVFCIWIALCIVVGMGALAGLSLSFLGERSCDGARRAVRHLNGQALLGRIDAARQGV